MLKLAPVAVETERREDVLYLRSGHTLEAPPARLTDPFRDTAALDPARPFVAERSAPGAALRWMSYGEAWTAARGIGARLLEGDRRPVLVLSGNGVDHLLITLGAYLAGVPVAPVSVAYSLMSQDHEKLRHIARKLRPGLIFTDRAEPYAKAVAAVREAAGEELVAITSEDLKAWMAPPIAAGAAALDAADVGPETVAKVLFTSGSTGFPKGVINTHGMLTANQQMIRQLWPFLRDEPPQLVDWLPWSHTFGGNHNVHMVLFGGGSLLIDDGKPTPALVDRTVANLRALPPTLYFNVPAGFAALVPRLEQDAALRDTFFSRLRLVFYAGAALPDDLWQRMVNLADASPHPAPFMTTAWGSTETSPLSTSAHFPLERAGNIGVPAPGVSLKLVPNGSKREVRIKGPHVMAGYLDEPELTAAAFDDEGYYRIGDAVKLADEADPSAGLLFDGRVAEDFKLSTGTWVNAGKLRTTLLTACSPALQDLVVAGHDREALGVLAWPHMESGRKLCDEPALDLAGLAAHDALRAHLRATIAAHNEAHPQSSTRIARALLLSSPPSIDAGEITDKGYINQRAVLERRADDVARLYGDDAALLRFDEGAKP